VAFYGIKEHCVVFRKPNYKLAGIVLPIAGAVLLVGAAASATHSYRFITTSQRTSGQVTDLIEKHARGIFFCPVFSYTDRDGVAHSISSSDGSNPPSYQVGDAVTVLYQPGAEENARLDDWRDLWKTSIVLGGCGIWSLVGGVLNRAWPRLTGNRQARSK
jgi:hypothetical protein